MLIGATIISFGTTLPEFSVSLLSASRGFSGLALGNAAGSVICNSGLIIGLCAIIRTLPYKRKYLTFQNRYQFCSGILLVLIPLIYSLIRNINPFKIGSRIPQFMGFVFLLLLLPYVIITIKMAQKAGIDDDVVLEPGIKNRTDTARTVLYLLSGCFIVFAASELLIPAVKEFAQRLHTPDAVIAATLIALGTALPELVTGLKAAKRGHGDLTIGNIIGSDILNILSVIGSSSAITPHGLGIDKNFFILMFPAMLIILFVFRMAIKYSRDGLRRPAGIVLLSLYIVFVILSYIFR
jgi:cation:H+ antiporter